MARCLVAFLYLIGPFLFSCQPYPPTSNKHSHQLSPFSLSANPEVALSSVYAYRLQKEGELSIIRAIEKEEGLSQIEKAGLYAKALEKLLLRGLQSNDFEKSAAALYGCLFAASPDLLKQLSKEAGRLDPRLQLMLVRALKNFQDDTTHFLIQQLMGSYHPLLRLELAHEIAHLRSPNAYDQLCALEQKTPDSLLFLFPPLFLHLASPESRQHFHGYLFHADERVRAAAVKAIGDENDKTFYPLLQPLLHDSSLRVRECMAYTLGIIAPFSHSSGLHTLKNSSHSFVRLSAMHAMTKRHEGLDPEVLDYAIQGNLFAYFLIPSTREELQFLKKRCFDTSMEKRLNAALALLYLQDNEAFSPLEELFIHNPSYLLKRSSPGRCLHAYSFVPYASPLNEEGQSHSHLLKRQVLIEATKLSNYHSFFDLLLENQVLEWIPTCLHLLVADSSLESQALIQKHLKTPGSPLLRKSCLLAAFRISPSEEGFESCVKIVTEAKQSSPFHKLMPWSEEGDFKSSYPGLTPQQNTQLRIDCLISHVRTLC